MNERRPATTIGELDLHLGYVQEALKGLQASVDNMATKSDLETLTRQMESLATKAELHALEERLSGQTVPGLFSRVASLAGRVAIIGSVLAAVVTGTVEAVRYFDSLQQARAAK